MKWFSRIVGICGLCTTMANNGYAGNADSMNILFIGNSYTHMNNMPKIFEKICISKGKKVHVEMNTRSGASFNVHTTRPDMYQAIKSRKWDVVVIQGYSREFSFEPAYLDTATIPYMVHIMDTIKRYSPCANIHLYLTWGYKDGFIERPETDSYEKMTDRIEFGYKYVSEIFSLPIDPVGLVWRELRKKHPSINLYDADNAHPNKNGSYLSACTHYAAIFRESPEGAITNTIGTKEAKEIQKHAAEVVLKRMNEFKLDINYYTVNLPKDKDQQQMVICKSYYVNAKSVSWDFGDGSTSKEKNVTYKYKKPGNYKVRLTVEDECGTRTFLTKITIPEPPKPKQKKKPKTTGKN
jgi:hypothetical protein